MTKGRLASVRLKTRNAGNKTSHRKIPKIIPCMYKPLQIQALQTRNAKYHLLNHPSEYKPPGGSYLEIVLKHRMKQSKNDTITHIYIFYLHSNYKLMQTVL